MNVGKKIPTVMIDTNVQSTGDADPMCGKLVEDTGCEIRTANKLLVFERRKIKPKQEMFLPFIIAIAEAAHRKEIGCYTYSGVAPAKPDTPSFAMNG